MQKYDILYIPDVDELLWIEQTPSIQAVDQMCASIRRRHMKQISTHASSAMIHLLQDLGEPIKHTKINYSI